MKDKPKYTHYFSIDFHIESDLEGAEDIASQEEIETIYKEARLHLKQRVDFDNVPLEWYDTKTND
jgi:hypothetical protein